MRHPTRADRRRLVAMLACAASILLAAAPTAGAAPRPVKELLSERIGWEINNTTGANDCSEEAHECKPGGEESGEAGGFAFPEGVSVGPAPQHYLYVADKVNGRIQVLTETGAFVSMFGWEVDRTTKANVCTAASKDQCQPGQPPAQSGEAGEIAKPTSIAVDQATGDIYVLDFTQNRVEKYTPGGEFVWMVGGEVNQTTKANLCTEAEIASKHVSCQAGTQPEAGKRIHGAFKYRDFRGNVLSVGAGTEDKALYVGDEGGVQEFDESGQYQGEVSVPGTVEALAVGAGGELYLTYGELPQTIHEYASGGAEVTEDGFPLTLQPVETRASHFFISTLSSDSAGRIAVAEVETSEAGASRYYGSLFGETGRLITGFALPDRSEAIAFDPEGEANGGDRMFIAAEGQQVLSYRPAAVGELVVKPANCTAGAEYETDATWNCQLEGEVNAWGVAETSAWFQYGRTCALGSESSKQAVPSEESPQAVEPLVVEGVRPNEAAFCYRLVGEDENVKAPEQFVSEAEQLTTPVVPAKIPSAPVVSFVGSASAVMFGELNPENAQTTYAFEYASGEVLAQCPEGVAHEACPGVEATATQQSDSYGLVGVTLSAGKLQPATEYRYRLRTESVGEGGHEHATNQSAEQTFVTLPAPAPKAQTGVSAVYGATSALITGTIDPDGEPATYAFELGVSKGAATRYGIVESASVEAGGATEEGLTLTGLQPGTEYAYRISVKSGYGEATGQAETFTTAGLPQALTAPLAPAILPIPPIAIPVEAANFVKPKAKAKAKPKPACTKGKRGKRRKCAPKKRKAKRGKGKAAVHRGVAHERGSA